MNGQNDITTPEKLSFLDVWAIGMQAHIDKPIDVGVLKKELALVLKG